MASDCSTVVSILPIKIHEFKPGLNPGNFLIPAVKNVAEDIEILVVTRAKFPVYLDENRPALVVPAPSDQVAESICMDYKLSMSHYAVGVAEPGLFWIPGELTIKDVKEKYAKELAHARKMQNEWFSRIVEAADDDWAKYHIRRAISPIQKLACSYLKLEREWNVEGEIAENLAMKKCKFCFADIHPMATVCSHCLGIQTASEYKKAG